MRYPVAVEVGDEDTAWGIVFPDLKGCFSAGYSLIEAMENAKEAIKHYLDVLRAHGNKEMPEPKSVDFWIKSGEYHGWLFTEIAIE